MQQRQRGTHENNELEVKQQQEFFCRRAFNSRRQVLYSPKVGLAFTQQWMIKKMVNTMISISRSLY